MITKKEQLLQKLKSLAFTEVVKNSGGQILAVGGILRDAFLNKESKDFDIMITGIKFDSLIAMLETFGKVDLVGESFGIIKFKEFGSTEDVDISLPRTEQLNGDRGHKAFDVTTDPFLPIESDLNRRDLTINSMAMDSEGNIIDPFNGLKDIENKVISMTNPDTFFDDPLRMLRAICFASRFNFNIAPVTFELIKQNASRLSEITPERILIELDKIVTKGNCKIGGELLIESGLSEVILKLKADAFRGSYDNLNLVKTMGEFIYVLLSKHAIIISPDGKNFVSAEDFYLKELKGDLTTGKELKALDILCRSQFSSNHMVIYWNIFEAIKIFPDIIHSKIFPLLEKQLKPFIERKLPRSRKDLEITGDDLVIAGYSGIDLGLKIDEIVDNIFHGTLQNKRSDLLKYIQKVLI